MATPDPRVDGPPVRTADPRLLRAAIWVAIGALIASALLCVVWVLIGSGGDIIGRAFSTILLMAAFAGAVILDVHLAPRRRGWFALASMIGWIVILVIGAVMIWLPTTRFGDGFVRFVEFLLIVLVIQLALLHVTLYAKAVRRNPATFVRVIAGITIALVGLLTLLLVLSLMLNEFIDFRPWFWRLVAAVTILAAVGTALVPLMNLVFVPRKPRAVAAAPQVAAGGRPWPTFADQRTPLPMLPDGTPDWNAFYTGRPSAGARAVGPFAPPASPALPNAGWPPPASAPGAPSAPGGYQGYPPAPPLPPVH